MKSCNIPPQHNITLFELLDIESLPIEFRRRLKFFLVNKKVSFNTLILNLLLERDNLTAENIHNEFLNKYQFNIKYNTLLHCLQSLCNLGLISKIGEHKNIKYKLFIY